MRRGASPRRLRRNRARRARAPRRRACRASSSRRRSRASSGSIRRSTPSSTASSTAPSRDAAGPLPDGPFTGVPFLFKDFGAQEMGEPHHQGMRALRDAGWRGTGRQPARAALPLARLHPGRADEHSRARDDGHDRARGLRADTQPVEPRSLPRRIVGRVGRGRRGRLRARRARERHRRVDPHPGLAVWSRRAQADAWSRDPESSFDAAVTMVSEGVITRTMRDTAAAARRPRRHRGDGPWPAPAFPVRSSTELGRDPGRLRIGLCLERVHRRGGRRRLRAGGSRRRATARGPRPPRRGGVAGRALRARPAGLAPRSSPPCRAPPRSTSGRPRSAETLGEDDVEPTTWSAISTGRALSGTDVVRALERQAGAVAGDLHLVAGPTATASTCC